MNEVAVSPPVDPLATVAVAGGVSVVARPTNGTPVFLRMSRQLRDWIRVLHHDPTAEERAVSERRARLLDELNRAVADAPDDMPLRDVIAGLNNPYRD